MEALVDNGSFSRTAESCLSMANKGPGFMSVPSIGSHGGQGRKISRNPSIRLGPGPLNGSPMTQNQIPMNKSNQGYNKNAQQLPVLHWNNHRFNLQHQHVQVPSTPQFNFHYPHPHQNWGQQFFNASAGPILNAQIPHHGVQSNYMNQGHVVSNNDFGYNRGHGRGPQYRY